MTAQKKLRSEFNSSNSLFQHIQGCGYAKYVSRDLENIEHVNCSACALAGAGYHSKEKDDRGNATPNYWGWERVYVQSMRAIPQRFLKAFRATVNGHGSNELYQAALIKDMEARDYRYPTASTGQTSLS